MEKENTRPCFSFSSLYYLQVWITASVLVTSNCITRPPIVSFFPRVLKKPRAGKKHMMSISIKKIKKKRKAEKYNLYPMFLSLKNKSCLKNYPKKIVVQIYFPHKILPCSTIENLRLDKNTLLLNSKYLLTSS